MKSYASWIVFFAVLAAIVGGMIWYASKPGQYDQFATCIKDSGATFYGAFWCPHCQEQKALFGKSAAKLPYVECSTPDGQGQTEICKQKNVESYPTWEFKTAGRKTGTFALAELSTFTGCPLVKNK
ncbi:hypothetical protein KW799_01490 [Candidatus Parcubacteria bacterium]|nr:hypothetical protein [Candidatus Parcubacteria bacterium]